VKNGEKGNKMGDLKLQIVLLFLLPVLHGEKVPEGRMRG
jgi:hypothetical protein